MTGPSPATRILGWGGGVPVSRPVLPPLEEFVQRLEGVWASAWLTNNGPCVQELERALAHELQVPHVVLVANGTLALQLAIRALGFRDSVVTTAFSFVATASSLVWEGCRPIFVDVEPDYFTIDPAAVDAAIGPETRGILATHVYGNPCDVEALEKIATKHGLPILYDAAHTFGATYRGRPVAAFGDAATLSFHATKIFHTVEGGAVVTADPNLAERVRRQRAFGEARPMEYQQVGINAKLSEVHAAMGLCLLPRVPEFIAARKAVAEAYDRGLASAGALVTRPRIRPGTTWNYAYYPVLLQDGEAVHRVQERLRREKVDSRRYFYPSLSDLPYVTANTTPVSRTAADRALCLPLWAGLETSRAEAIAGLVLEALTPG